ncbi:MAG: amidohydrolase family protein [Crocinitomicaceae bacterium]|nr:amidohydrolase family protein [Crocinitomicaceae bacterium]
MKRIALFFFIIIAFVPIQAQVNETFPYNGVRPKQLTAVAIVHATVFIDDKTQVDDATLLIRNGKIEASGTGIKIPDDAVVIDATGKFIYPSFIDLYSEYGLNKYTPVERKPGPQIESTRKGAFGWNEAIRPDIRSALQFVCQPEAAAEYRSAGFGTVLTHRMDGIARGTSALVTLGSNENNNLLIADAAAHYSFSKGFSMQDYPSSLMGSIALLRQTYYDAEWYKKGGEAEERNLSLEAWNNEQALPQIFEANDKWNILRADKIGDEFGIRYIIKTSGNEYQRINEVKNTQCPLIVPLNFPAAFNVSDPHTTRLVSLAEMKHWEMAPSNPATIAKAGIPFAMTLFGLNDKADFLKNIRKAVSYGLSEEEALGALTTVPAVLIHAEHIIGTLKPGYFANFIICDKKIFTEGATIKENWVQGEAFVIEPENPISIKGKHRLSFERYSLTLDIKGEPGDYKGSSAGIITREVESGGVASAHSDSVSFKVKISQKGNYISLVLNPDSVYSAHGIIRLSGYVAGGQMAGEGQLSSGEWVKWETSKIPPSGLENEPAQNISEKKIETPVSIGKIIYPFGAFGSEELPVQETVWIKNATVWTCDSQGVIENGQVLISGGKIIAVGKSVDPGNLKDVRVIDATGKHISPGIIDEHSHIALMSVNEGAQASSAEVQEASVISPEDIRIYRQLSGGVTAAQLLHGSANPIGGQSAIIKLRWGKTADQMLIEEAPPFIKFALGENVKQSNWGDLVTKRFPQTRMGVEQVYYDHFIRAKEYGEAWRKFNTKSSGNKKNDVIAAPRRDLEMDALLEILEKKRFITCHSYVQSEINMLMHVADSMGFAVNTFTHVLEGYKIADKIKKHGAGVSTFSDWWAYKMEVKDAIPYNGALMWKNGLTVAFNSDDPEMGRRLNQEAGKAVKYGGVPEEEALKFVTLNPAILLHLDNRMGSLTKGKDADLVIWSDNPLSIYAIAEKTFVDGICYYDRSTEEKRMKEIEAEKSRIIQKMLDAKSAGEETQEPKAKENQHLHCDTLGNIE